MATPPESTVSATRDHAWRRAFAWGVTAIAALALWKAATVVLLFFAGVLGALLLLSLARCIVAWTGGRPRIALSAVLLVLAAALGWLLWAAAPSLRQQAASLQDQLQASSQQLDLWLESHGTDLPVDSIGEVLDQLANNGLWARVAGIFSTTIGALGAATLILFLAIFLAYDPNHYVSGVLRLVPRPRRRRAAEVMSALNETLTRWLIAQLASMIFLGVSTWVVLWLLDVPMALLLATLTGLLTFVPYLGPLLALIPIVLIAFVEGPMLALYAALAFLVVQNVEGNIFMPLVYQKTVRLPPALTLSSQVLAGALFGLPGFMLATPLAAVGLVMVRMLYVQDTLGDDLEKPIAEVGEVTEPMPGAKAPS